MSRSDGVTATSVRMTFTDVGEPSPLWAAPSLCWLYDKGAKHDVKGSASEQQSSVASASVPALSSITDSLELESVTQRNSFLGW